MLLLVVSHNLAYCRNYLLFFPQIVTSQKLSFLSNKKVKKNFLCRYISSFYFPILHIFFNLIFLKIQNFFQNCDILSDNLDFL